MPCRVVHLDLKSSNVLIAGDGSAKISDVGLAALMSQDHLSQVALAGTWSWLAPEVIQGGEFVCMHMHLSLVLHQPLAQYATLLALRSIRGLYASCGIDVLLTC